MKSVPKTKAVMRCEVAEVATAGGDCAADDDDADADYDAVFCAQTG